MLIVIIILLLILLPGGGWYGGTRGFWPAQAGLGGGIGLLLVALLVLWLLVPLTVVAPVGPVVH